MHFTPFGGADEIGASCYLLEIAGHRILVDCGLRPSVSGQASLPGLSALPEPDLVIVTHAHLDHTGALPLLHRRFPDLPILITPGTYTLLKILLADAVRVMEYHYEAANNDQPPEPLYTWDDVGALIKSLTVQPSAEWFHPLPDVAACLAPAGHILGAAMVLLDTPEGRAVVSGDVALAHQRTVRGAGVPDFAADLLVLESTYGLEAHPDRVSEERELARVVAEVVVGGGVALVPAFAVGRAQEVILTLRAMQRAGAIPEFPIYIDGLVRAVCGAYRKRWQDLSPDLQALLDSGANPFRDKWSRPVGPRWRDQLPRPGEPCCIVSSSGMLTGGPSVGYAQRVLEQPQNTIIFPGYTDEESPGRRLQELEPGDELKLQGESLTVQAQVVRVSLSAHADGPQLKHLVEHFRPRAVVLVHGEPETRAALGEVLSERCPVYLPTSGQRIEPVTPPRWMGSMQASGRYAGQVHYTDRRVVIELERGILSEPAWGQHYAGHDEVNARFLGERLAIEPGKPKSSETMDKRPLMPVEEEEIEILVETPPTEEQKMAETWYESDFACMLCGAPKRYRAALDSRQVEWTCPECGHAFQEMIMRLRDKDLQKMEANDKLRLLQFIHVSLRLHEPVLPENWMELVAQRYWERWLEG